MVTGKGEAAPACCDQNERTEPAPPARAVAPPNGGFRVAGRRQCQLRNVTGERRLLAPDRRFGAVRSCDESAVGRAQNIQIWLVLRAACLVVADD